MLEIEKNEVLHSVYIIRFKYVFVEIINLKYILNKDNRKSLHGIRCECCVWHDKLRSYLSWNVRLCLFLVSCSIYIYFVCFVFFSFAFFFLWFILVVDDATKRCAHSQNRKVCILRGPISVPVNLLHSINLLRMGRKQADADTETSESEWEW